jgi:hypothetical protein
MSSLASAVLMLALAAAGGLAFALNRRLARLGDDLAEYRGAMEAVAAALAAAESSLRQLSTEGRAAAAALSARITEAHALAAASAEPAASRPPRTVAAADFRVLAGSAPEAVAH